MYSLYLSSSGNKTFDKLLTSLIIKTQLFPLVTTLPTPKSLEFYAIQQHPQYEDEF